MKYPKLLFLTVILLLSLPAFSQQAEEVEMASKDKLFVVLAVALIILIGLIIYLVTIDRKVSRLEKKNQDNP